MVMWAEGLLIVVFCVLIGVNAFVLGRRGLASRRSRDDGRPDEIERLMEAVAEAQAENAELRDRLQVLERLATDEDAQLAREINKLKRRDKDRDRDRDRDNGGGRDEDDNRPGA